MKLTVIRFDTIDSTNTEALRHAKAGADEGLCIIAREQTAGRGRLGRKWVSNKDSGLFFSILLRPNIETRFLPIITLMTGVAVSETLAKFGVCADIKWVNDVLVNEKKIAGILAETVETPQGLAVVVGIGINVRSQVLPSEIAERSTSIDAETSRQVSIDELVEALTRRLGYFYDVFHGESGTTDILKQWEKGSSYSAGKRISVRSGNAVITGVTDGLEPTGALRVREDNGAIRIIQAGEVERVRTVAERASN